MHKEVSTRHKLVCFAIAVVVCAAYLGFCVYAVGSAWQRKEGDLSAISATVQKASLFLVRFPFGFLPWSGRLFIAPILNGLLWSTMTALFYARYVRRKNA
jgi:hypothetical protein